MVFYNMNTNDWPADKIEYLRQESMVPGHLYRIIARNANYGIWVTGVDGFIIARTKFNDTFLFVEYHWDGGCEEDEMFGTAKPIKDLGDTPFDDATLKQALTKDDRNILKFLCERENDDTID